MTATMDLDYVRRQFPAFAEPTLQGQAFFENAGGSYACTPVTARLSEYYRRLKVQPGYPSAASTEAARWMDTSHAALARYLGVSADELHFGPSTSQNTYVLAQALKPLLKVGDEIIVTNQDHEANSGAWRRLAESGVVVREWRVDSDTGALDLAELDALINTRTRLIACTHCSNVVAHVNPVAQITARARAAGALSVIDGVAWAPHGLPDVSALGADVYLFSLYKTFGPHQGVMVVRQELQQRLANQGHFFNDALPRKRLVPAGPDHAQVAAAQGVAEYFDALDAHHGGANDAQRPARVRALLRHAETPLLATLLDYLGTRPDLRLLGSSDAQRRAATVAFVPQHVAPAELATRLARHSIMAGHGHFYAVRLLQALGVDPARGVLRLSFLHYTSAAEVQQLLRALDAELG